MFGPQNPRLPTEVCLSIFKSHALTAIDLLRCAGVNRRWHALIQNTNDIRALLFLPPLTSHGDIDKIKAPAQDEPAWVALLYRPPPRLMANFIFADEALLPSWEGVVTHPLLFEFKYHAPQDYIDPYEHADAEGTEQPQRGYLGFTYQLFQHLSQPQYVYESASWRHMRVVHPPIRDVLIRVHPRWEIMVHNEWGVTLGDVVEELRNSKLWKL